MQRWFFTQQTPRPDHFNQALLLEVRRPVDTALLRQALRLLRELDLGSGVVEDVVLAREPLEEGFERRQAPELSAKRQGLAVVLAVVEEVTLVALENRLGDRARIIEIALEAPGDESTNGDAPRVDRVRGVAGHRHPLAVAVHVTREYRARDGVVALKEVARRPRVLLRRNAVVLDALPFARHR